MCLFKPNVSKRSSCRYLFSCQSNLSFSPSRTPWFRLRFLGSSKRSFTRVCVSQTHTKSPLHMDGQSSETVSYHSLFLNPPSLSLSSPLQSASCFPLFFLSKNLFSLSSFPLIMNRKLKIMLDRVEHFLGLIFYPFDWAVENPVVLLVISSLWPWRVLWHWWFWSLIGRNWQWSRCGL